MTIYESMSLLFQLAGAGIALFTLMITVVVLLSKKKQPSPRGEVWTAILRLRWPAIRCDSTNAI